MEFNGKLALVTGAGSGIGKSAALMLAGRGAFIGLLGRTADELHEALEEIRREGGDGVALVADISDAVAMRDALKTLRSF